MQMSGKTIRELLSDDFEYTEIVLQYLLNLSKSNIILNSKRELSQDDFDLYNDIKNKYNNGIPLQYAIGKWNFFGYDFVVNENVLIPRPETEILVEEILKVSKDGTKILDIGTGSGAIAVSLKLEKEKLDITASDISKETLEVAIQNADILGSKIKFIHSDLFENIKGKFDIIVSNPPYLTEEEYQNVDKLLYSEPKIALVGGNSGYEVYEKIIENAKEYLNDNGKLFFEIGFSQAEKISELLEKNGYNNIRIIKDYNRLDRIVIGELCLNN